MPRLLPVRAKTLIKIFVADGWEQVRQNGSHVSLVKRGFIRPLVIPVHGNAEIQVGVIQSNLRTAKMSRERYFELLAQVG